MTRMLSLWETASVKTFARCLPALLLAAFLSSPVFADDVKKEEPKKPDVKKEEPKKPDAKKEDKKPEPYAGLFGFPKTITLDDKQSKALEDIKKEFLPKLQELDKKASAIVTPERAKAREEAVKKAKEDGKKGK